MQYATICAVPFQTAGHTDPPRQILTNVESDHALFLLRFSLQPSGHEANTVSGKTFVWLGCLHQLKKETVRKAKNYKQQCRRAVGRCTW